MTQLQNYGVITQEEYEQAEREGKFLITDDVVCSYCQAPIRVQNQENFIVSSISSWRYPCIGGPIILAFQKKFHDINRCTFTFQESIRYAVHSRKNASQISQRIKVARFVIGTCRRRIRSSKNTKSLC